MKNYQEFEKDQNAKIEKQQNELGKSVLMAKFEEPDKEDEIDVFAALPQQDFPIPAMARDQDSSGLDSRNYLADQIQPKFEEPKKAKKGRLVVEQHSDLDEEKDKEDIQPEKPPREFKQYGDSVIDYDKINSLGKQIEQKRSINNSNVQSAVVNMSGNVLKPALSTPDDLDDFEEVGNSEAVELDMKQEADF